MCGRFALGIPRKAIGQRFGLDHLPNAPARYNIAPGQLVEAVLAAPQKRMGLFRWGLVPSWAKDASMGAKLINARAETAAVKPAFRAAMRRRRCLVPAQGFYEWSGEKSGKRQPWFITALSGVPLALAALWEHFESPEGEIIDSLAILTCEANAQIAPLHHRMPVLVRQEDDARWLNSRLENLDAVEDILAPREWPEMNIYRVGTLVNAPTREGPELILPLPEQDSQGELG